MGIIFYFVIFLIIIFFFVTPNEFSCNSKITNITDIINISECIQEELKYEITSDKQPLQVSLMKGRGDCYDRAKYLQIILNKNHITNSLQICNVVGTDNSVMHARNLVFINNSCYIVDTAILINSTIIRPCNYRPDYCV